MNANREPHRFAAVLVLGVLLLAAGLAAAQSSAPASPPPAAPSAPASPVGTIRNKLSAGDLRSAEAALEVYRQKFGEDDNALLGLSWLARGAFLADEPAKAKRYVAQVRARCADSVAHGAGPAKNDAVELALGAAIETEAQMRAREKGVHDAAAFLRAELARYDAPMTLRARIIKRLHMLTLAGQAAPELAPEDALQPPAPTLASLRGSPVLVFVFADGCGDCKASAPGLARLHQKYGPDGLHIVALTRYHATDVVERATEKARVDSVWKAVYPELGPVPVVFSTASVEAYGGSSTPTFAFVDRRGVVRGYTPTRLTEAEFDEQVARILH